MAYPHIRDGLILERFDTFSSRLQSSILKAMPPISAKSPWQAKLQLIAQKPIATALDLEVMTAALLKLEPHHRSLVQQRLRTLFWKTQSTPSPAYHKDKITS